MGDVEEKATEVMEHNKGKELLDPKLSPKCSGDDEILPTSKYEVYPEAFASYQEVVANKTLFMESLEKLHFAMKTKFMIPTIGGKELELHQLFVEVTSRGGIEKVIADRRWREVTNAFNFPSTATNASFILRKYYLSLLRHYEQIYFFGARSWSIPSAVPFRALPTTTFEPEKIARPVFSFPETQFAMRKRRKANIAVAPTVTFGSVPSNQTVVGVIDGKFDDGYFVTVTVGGRKLKGVLFHASQQSAVKEQTILHGIGDDNGTRVIRRRRRRKNLSSRDPTHPKPNRSGYNFFFSEQRAKLKLLHPGKEREISKMIGDLWNNQTEAERAVYQEIGLKDKQRYQREMAAYRENQRTALVLSNVRAIQQAAPELSIKAQNTDSKEEDDVDMLSEDCTDSDGEKSEDEPKMSNLQEARTAAGTEAVDPLAFELRRRDIAEAAVIDAEMGIKSNLPCSGNNTESGKVGQTSADMEWSKDELR